MFQKQKPLSVLLVTAFLAAFTLTGYARANSRKSRWRHRHSPANRGSSPDLAIEEITLNENCFVVVRVKNNGPGMVPDEVWRVTNLKAQAFNSW